MHNNTSLLRIDEGDRRMTRREFEFLLAAPHGAAQSNASSTGSHIGNLYPFVQKQADRAPREMSFLRPEFRDLKKWQKLARAKVLEHMFYAPLGPEGAPDPQPHVIDRADRGDYLEEH